MSQNFEEKVCIGLKNCGISPEKFDDLRIGVAVSGGADSISLLVSLAEIFNNKNLFVITVDHNIRSKNESGGDAEFVFSFCQKREIFCHVAEIQPGVIHEIAKNRGNGLEEAARFARYNEFEKFIEFKNLDFLCLAHNLNDFLETSLMRFLSGSGIEGNSGIKASRGKYIRPLLRISRQEIEGFLSEKNISWRTDSTNFDNKYTRNKIRNVLVPFLNDKFAGWQKSIISGVEKNSDDEDFLNSVCEKIIWKEDKSTLYMNSSEFYSYSPAIQRRLVFKAVNLLKLSGRFPFSAVRTVTSWNVSCENSLSVNGIFVKLSSGRINISKLEEKEIESGFSYIIDGEQPEFCKNFSGTIVEVTCDHFLKVNSDKIMKIDFPLAIRTVQVGDKIADSAGNFRYVSKIFSDWKIPVDERCKIPIVQALNDFRLIAVLGEISGGKNWIVNVSDKSK